MKDFDTLTRRGRARRMRALAAVALADYDLRVTRLRLITNMFNTIFRVDTADGEKYVLRICRASETPDGLSTLRAEAAWLAALARDTNIWTLAPVPTRSGDYVTMARVPEVPEARYCMVFTWLPGRTVNKNLSDDNALMMGALMAQLHQHAALWTPDEPLDVIRYDTPFPIDPLRMFDDEFANMLTPERRAFFMESADRIQAAIDRLAAIEPARIIHGDMHRWNVMVHRGMMSVFDFQDIQWGWPVQDIGTSLYYFHGDPAFPRVRAAFQRGYEQVAPWPEREPGEVDLFIAARGLMLANSLLMDEDPEWRAEAERYFVHTEDRLRAIFAGEPFEKSYW